MDIFYLLDIAISNAASDMHLSADSPPLMRVNGVLKPMNGATPLTESDLIEMMQQLATPEELALFKRDLEIDFSYGMADGMRLRCCAVRQRNATALTIRVLQPRVPTIDELQLPEIYKELSLMEKGLVVISGPTGSGKTTTQAAMIQHINLSRTKHILTLEDPIEYSHPNINSRITQRELGGDTTSFNQALKRALRVDPDVILVGEMRDAETAAAALSLAETGHFVITTSHAPYASQTLERIIDLFPFEQRSLVQMRLGTLLTAVLCQTLVPRLDHSGRIAAVEVLIVTSAIRNIIRDGKLYNIPNAMRSSRKIGSVTMDEALVRLYKTGVINMDAVSEYCHDIDEVSALLREWIAQPRQPEKPTAYKTFAGTAPKNGTGIKM